MYSPTEVELSTAAIEKPLFSRFEAKAIPVTNTCPIVLINGWGCDNSSWQPMIQALGHTHELLLCNLEVLSQHMIDRPHSHNLEKLVEILAAELTQPSYVIGWSLGGMFATKLAADFPDKVSGLITLATNLCFSQQDRWPWAMPRAQFSEFRKHFESQPQQTMKQFNRLQVSGDHNLKHVLKTLNVCQTPMDLPQQRTHLQQQLLWLHEFNNIDASSRVRCPGLHLYGDSDVLVPIAASKHAFDASDQHTISVYQNTGHAPHLSQPEKVAVEISEFIACCQQPQSDKRKKRIAQSFSKAASQYDQEATLQKSIAEQLVSFAGKLQGNVVDLGSGTGFIAERLDASEIELVAQVDLSLAMLKAARSKSTSHAVAHPSLRVQQCFLAGDMHNLPLPNNSFNVFISSMSVQWSDSLALLLQEIYRILTPGGRFIFSTVGPKTLHELKQAWRTVDDFVHVNQFIALEQINDLAQGTGFRILNQKTTTTVLEYNDSVEVMHSVKNIGAHVVNAGQAKGLMGKRKLDLLKQSHELFRLHNGKLPVTWEVYFLDLEKSV